ncbi:MAG: MMPL family transporter [Clostridiales bacterium]|nr:MMPL family transporter [Clostridiales bacterium]
MRKIITKLIGTIERRAWYFIMLAVLLTLMAIPGILKLETETGMNTLVSPDSQIFQDTKRHDTIFGAESIIVFLEGCNDDILSQENLLILSQLENEIIKHSHFHSILSPITILNLAVEEALIQKETFENTLKSAIKSATEEAMRASSIQGLNASAQAVAVSQAQEAVMNQFLPYIDSAKKIGEPSLENQAFVNMILYDENGQLHPALKDFFPTDNTMVFAITPVGNIPHETSLALVEYLNEFFLHNPLINTSASVIADVLIIEAIADQIGGDLTFLLGFAVIVMALILLFVFPVRWRLLSLFMVGVSATWTFGLMGYLGVPLSMATMAVLPVLIGLGIDYSVQFHNHFQEKLNHRKSFDGTLVASAIYMFPAAGIALLATIIGFITLYISEVPMVRDFGIILSIGVLFSFLSALFLLHSSLYLLEKKTPIHKLRKSANNNRLLEKVLSQVARKTLKFPLFILVIALMVGAMGLYADTQLQSSTDFKELMSQDDPILQDLDRLSAVSDKGPPLHFLVDANNVTSPEFLKWLYDYQEKILASCPNLLSIQSIATLISNASDGQIPNTQEEIDDILKNTPEIFVNQFISPDRKMASFAISGKHISMEEQHNLVKQFELDSTIAPSNVAKTSVGMVALGASIVESIMDSRFVLNALCLFAILIVLLLVYRRFVSVIITIISVALVITWSSLVLYVANIPLNPLTAVLGVIVIGIGAEFMVLITSRYEIEKKQGSSPMQAMTISISKIGRAVVITALTTLGGFGVLITSDFVLIRDFGIATVSGVFLCLISSMIVMPPLLVFYDEKVRQKS